MKEIIDQIRKQIQEIEEENISYLGEEANENISYLLNYIPKSKEIKQEVQKWII